LVTGVHPLDYETELDNKKNEIKRDKLNDLLLFPEDDISVRTILFVFLIKIFV